MGIVIDIATRRPRIQTRVPVVAPIESVEEWEKRRAIRLRARSARHSALRRAAKIQRTPKWADLGRINSIYLECARLTKETGLKHNVDHIIPLRGELVSGLHVHENLQILTASENNRKYNFWNPD